MTGIKEGHSQRVGLLPQNKTCTEFWFIEDTVAAVNSVFIYYAVDVFNRECQNKIMKIGSPHCWFDIFTVVFFLLVCVALLKAKTTKSLQKRYKNKNKISKAEISKKYKLYDIILS